MFQNPKPPRPWSGVYSATKDAPACVQSNNVKLPDNPATTSEDCLYLNVFTPKVRLETYIYLRTLVYFYTNNINHYLYQLYQFQ